MDSTGLHWIPSQAARLPGTHMPSQRSIDSHRQDPGLRICFAYKYTQYYIKRSTQSDTQSPVIVSADKSYSFSQPHDRLRGIKAPQNEPKHHVYSTHTYRKKRELVYDLVAHSTEISCPMRCQSPAKQTEACGVHCQHSPSLPRNSSQMVDDGVVCTMLQRVHSRSPYDRYLRSYHFSVCGITHEQAEASCLPKALSTSVLNQCPSRNHLNPPAILSLPQPDPHPHRTSRHWLQNMYRQNSVINLRQPDLASLLQT